MKHQIMKIKYTMIDPYEIGIGKIIIKKQTNNGGIPKIEDFKLHDGKP